jgi:hypothetical protein
MGILDENAAKEKLNSLIWLDFALATFRDSAMLMGRIKKN